MAEITESGQSKCKRCGHRFKPRKEGQEFGPTCARKVAMNQQLGMWADEDPRGVMT